MSYAMAPALQAAIFQHLANDATLQAALQGAIYDAIPPATPPATYALIGTEDAIDRSDKTGAGAEHRLTIAVVTNATGFLAAKDIAARICDVLATPLPALARGRVVGLWFERAQARKLEGNQTRRIDLRFRARLEDND
ncbi:DUF3168 domain-containing protein [Roseinatronobacter alkalisoli]|uniref:DUF3168 domain-containing protein n=1 Tax=Roseinatronobacter alkalisoli TaxID=3028235 RepID=A0ABT5T883_9RHOB|nr:DUF3168 domain-containing protein [Roseinatronobacter sp. HJB301]MDD7971333.1 DUF3168 domain-containing protein [Roseinatronobacter sp. HJB301]